MCCRQSETQRFCQVLQVAGTDRRHADAVAAQHIMHYIENAALLCPDMHVV